MVEFLGCMRNIKSSFLWWHDFYFQILRLLALCLAFPDDFLIAALSEDVHCFCVSPSLFFRCSLYLASCPFLPYKFVSLNLMAFPSLPRPLTCVLMCNGLELVQKSSLTSVSVLCRLLLSLIFWPLMVPVVPCCVSYSLLSVIGSGLLIMVSLYAVWRMSQCPTTCVVYWFVCLLFWGHHPCTLCIQHYLPDCQRDSRSSRCPLLAICGHLLAVTDPFIPLWMDYTG